MSQVCYSHHDLYIDSTDARHDAPLRVMPDSHPRVRQEYAGFPAAETNCDGRTTELLFQNVVRLEIHSHKTSSFRDLAPLRSCQSAGSMIVAKASLPPSSLTANVLRDQR